MPNAKALADEKCFLQGLQSSPFIGLGTRRESKYLTAMQTTVFEIPGFVGE